MIDGYFMMTRGWMDHAAFAGQAYDDRSSYCWLMEHASFKARRQAKGKIEVELKRGQLAVTARALAPKWGCSPSTVDRRLKRFAQAKLIALDVSGAQVFAIDPETGERDMSPGQVTTRPPTIITVLDYEEIQAGRLAANDGERDRVATQGGETSIRSKEDLEPTSTSYLPSVDNSTTRSGDLFGHNTGPDPTIDLSHAARGSVWELGVPLLRTAGKSDGDARKLIGKWVRQAGADLNPLLSAITGAIRVRTGDPVSYVAASLRNARQADEERTGPGRTIAPGGW